MYDYLLPIGTVVKLKDAEKCLMIFGVLQKSQLENGEVRKVDYIGVPHPAGFITSSFNIGFNHDQIETVVAKGFENGTEWEDFKHALEYAEIINGKKPQ